MLSREQFDQYAARGYNRIPLAREALADLETPLSTYLKLAAGPYSYLLESVHGGEKWGRYSIIGLPCRRRLEVRAGHLRIIEHGGDGDGDGAGDRADTVDIMLLVSDEVVVFDNLSGRVSVIVHADPATPDAWARGAARLDELLAGLATVLPAHADSIAAAATQSNAAGATDAADEPAFTSSFPRAEFEAAVEKCREYIYQGDVFQVVISQRMALPFAAAPLDLYRALRTLNPSPYMYYLDCGGFHIAGASPEILVRLEDGEVTVRPIAGTRKRGADAQEDAALAAELLSDPKELAEHLMLVDLGQGAGDGNHRGSRAGQARHLFRRGRLHRLERQPGHRHRHPHRAHPKRHGVYPGRRRHRRRLAAGARMGGDHEQGAGGAARRRHGRRRAAPAAGLDAGFGARSGA